MMNMALLARNPQQQQSRCKSILCFVFSRISIILAFASLPHNRIVLTSTQVLARTAQQQTSLVPEQEVNYRYNKNIALLLIIFIGMISTVVQLLLLLLATRIILALIILKTMIIVASKTTVNGVTIVFVVTMPSPTFQKQLEEEVCHHGESQLEQNDTKKVEQHFREIRIWEYCQ